MTQQHPGAPFRGIYGIPPTPFNEDESLDRNSLESVLHFTVESGCHGVVMPVMVSEFEVLTDEERKEIVETTVSVVAGRVPVVAGVTGVANAHSIGLAKHAQDAGVDAVIAMPPHSRATTESEVVRFFHELGAAVDLPVFVQNFGGAYAMPTPTLAKLVHDVPNVSYVKEEGSEPLQAATRIIEAAGDDILGVMGGFGARMLIDEWRRGEAGNMPASHYGDVHSRIWNLLEEGDEKGARAIYERILPLVLHDNLMVIKEIFVRRGVIANNTMRSPYGITAPDRHGWDEIDYLRAQASDLFTWKKS
ncbi:MAG: dihydrodipicolinate synthase family protein [Dehalococcoidia bacterium]|nr:dihydrodipicolinate synthase family protein [Dehalococcoidia bacterium]MDP7213045.1 dihydrodipicolinate synthase family protein [Dehalococcoidia bacterium]MDP7514527.1 dihydrodipicolinate synthase family protein [Dehalococcoidia bacterium]